MEAVGEAVTGLTPGDHVVLTFDSCGIRDGCRTGRPDHCAAFEALNFGASEASARDGDGTVVGNRWFGQSSFAGYCIATERNTVKVDREVPLEMLGPLGCGVLTGAGSVLNVMRLRPGDRLAVFGAGAVGLAAILAARASGAGEIVAVDLHENRRALALELGGKSPVFVDEPRKIMRLRRLIAERGTADRVAGIVTPTAGSG